MMNIVINSVVVECVRPVRHAVLRTGKPYDSTLWTGDNEPDTRHFAAYTDGQLVGVASVYRKDPPDSPGQHGWQLRGMAVLPEYQRYTIGRLLVDAIKKHCREQGGQIIWCNARESARGFYEKLGFTAVGEPFLIPEIGPHFLMKRPQCL